MTDWLLGATYEFPQWSTHIFILYNSILFDEILYWSFKIIEASVFKLLMLNYLLIPNFYKGFLYLYYRKGKRHAKCPENNNVMRDPWYWSWCWSCTAWPLFNMTRVGVVISNISVLLAPCSLVIIRKHTVTSCCKVLVLAGGEGTQSVVVDSIRKIQFCLACLKIKVLQIINFDQNSQGLRRNLKTMLNWLQITFGIVIYRILMKWLEFVFKLGRTHFG